jgi:anti-sigma factor RsiW
MWEPLRRFAGSYVVMASIIYRARFRWDHRWTTAHMSDYVDGDLRRSGLLRAERHIRECADCQRGLASLRGMLEALHRLPVPTGGSDPGQTAAAVRRRLQEPPQG